MEDSERSAEFLIGWLYFGIIKGLATLCTESLRDLTNSLFSHFFFTLAVSRAILLNMTGLGFGGGGPFINWFSTFSRKESVAVLMLEDILVYAVFLSTTQF